MSKFSLDDLDKHIENLRAQLQFLNEGLDATDHNAPDWLATDLLSLRNKSGRLQDDMKRFRHQLESEGLATKKTKITNKRLSIEGAKAPGLQEPSVKKVRLSLPGSEETTEIRPTDNDLTSQANPAQTGSTYVVEHIDVTEEVNRRLQESRLRRLMETPSTAQKRKRGDDEDTRMASGTEAEPEPTSGYDGNNDDSTPTKRVRTSGAFERATKREMDEDEGRHGTENRFKRRKYSWKSKQ
ncbi:uncharacterized protein EKO05_0007801 [Ascochyta rabiei]|uniref:uncharacterized protein n=1 Tax=Didymella rabiei TaxID=5454 RepID=UPI00220AD1B4|nr:uncharacterized protein EKO05_0007801 [Ascochyta rabiei]UPX17448.1 hypothetical protein EKO05_0007801 [Ascochyta rabiei]